MRPKAHWTGRAALCSISRRALRSRSIREKHGFTDQPVDTDLDEDEKIIEALDRPASKMQFAYIEDNDELRRVIEGGDFAAWRIFLHPEQRKYVESEHGRPIQAVRRCRHRKDGRRDSPRHAGLAREIPSARIILTTFNTALADGLKADLAALDPDVPDRRASLAMSASMSAGSTRWPKR